MTQFDKLTMTLCNLENNKTNTQHHLTSGTLNLLTFQLCEPAFSKYMISGAAKSKSSGSSAAAGAKAAAVSKTKKPKTTKATKIAEAEKVESNGSRFPFKSTQLIMWNHNNILGL